jgi:hypothetical protein
VDQAEVGIKGHGVVLKALPGNHAEEDSAIGTKSS